jgi:predicted nucleotidyltransferase
MTKVIFKYLAGSFSYGTNTPESDVDYRGIFMPDLKDYLTVTNMQEEIEGPGEDEKYYSVRKFLSLYTKCNPNIVEFLWCEPDNIVLSTPEYELLRAHREQLLCRNVLDSFMGYATSRVKKLETELFQPWSVRAASHKAWGYDTKDAMHLVRLMRMGVEILEGKGVLVRRHDANELQAIRNGEWELSEVLNHAEELKQKFRELELTTTLQEHPQYELANKLMGMLYFNGR